MTHTVAQGEDLAGWRVAFDLYPPHARVPLAPNGSHTSHHDPAIAEQQAQHCTWFHQVPKQNICFIRSRESDLHGFRQR